MNSLDSRYLRLGDTFGHRFTTAGAYRYGIGVAGEIAPFGDHHPWEIVVDAEPSSAPTTHYVVVSYANGAFGADPETLRIRRNDGVLWSTPSPTTPGFAVRGACETASFDSSEMPANSLYSHAFGALGEFSWSSVQDPKLNGRVTVTGHPPCHTAADREGYLAKLSEATLVMIDGLKAHPKKVSVTLGQTVFFAVRSGGGVAIVDRALLGAGQGNLQATS